MSFLPIVERELRVRARHPATYRIRMGAAAATIGLAGLLLLQSLGASPAGFGLGMLKLFAFLTYLFCLAEGMRNTADSLSEEKRDGTLGLLFLTDLKGYDVVLGKLMATSVNSFYALLAVFPPMAIPLIIGGVTFGEFGRVALALGNALLFSLSAGLAISSVSRYERRAWSASLLIVLLLGGVFALFGLLPFPLSCIGWLSPTTTLWTAFASLYDSERVNYWGSFLTILGLSGGMLGCASILLPRCWQDQVVRAAIPRPQFKRRGDEQYRRRLLDSNPVVWHATRNEASRRNLTWLVGVSVTVAILVWVVSGFASPVGIGIAVSGLLLHFTIALWATVEACHHLADARDSGALELLLCTPIDDREIVEGYFFALERFFFRPLSILISAEVGAVILGAFVFTYHGGEPSSLIPFLFGAVFCIGAATTEVYAASHVGLWMGLKCRKPSQAIARTVLYVHLLPVLGVVCCVGMPLFALVKNALFINHARDQLRRNLRPLLSQRFEGQAAAADTRRFPFGKRRKSNLPDVLPGAGR